MSTNNIKPLPVAERIHGSASAGTGESGGSAMSFVTIIPGEMRGSVNSAQGTKVLLPDGTDLGGVTKIILSAEVDDVWRAEIHTFGVMLGQMKAVPIIRSGKLSWWRRLLCRVAGVALEKTEITDTSRQWGRP